MQKKNYKYILKLNRSVKKIFFYLLNCLKDFNYSYMKSFFNTKCIKNIINTINKKMNNYYNQNYLSFFKSKNKLFKYSQEKISYMIFSLISIFIDIYKSIKNTFINICVHLYKIYSFTFYYPFYNFFIIKYYQIIPSFLLFIIGICANLLLQMTIPADHIIIPIVNATEDNPNEIMSDELFKILKQQIQKNKTHKEWIKLATLLHSNNFKEYPELLNSLVYLRNVLKIDDYEILKYIKDSKDIEISYPKDSSPFSNYDYFFNRHTRDLNFIQKNIFENQLYWLKTKYFKLMLEDEKHNILFEDWPKSGKQHLRFKQALALEHGNFFSIINFMQRRLSTYVHGIYDFSDHTYLLPSNYPHLKREPLNHYTNKLFIDSELPLPTFNHSEQQLLTIKFLEALKKNPAIFDLWKLPIYNPKPWKEAFDWPPEHDYKKLYMFKHPDVNPYHEPLYFFFKRFVPLLQYIEEMPVEEYLVRSKRTNLKEWALFLDDVRDTGIYEYSKGLPFKYPLRTATFIEYLLGEEPTKFVINKEKTRRFFDSIKGLNELKYNFDLIRRRNAEVPRYIVPDPFLDKNFEYRFEYNLIREYLLAYKELKNYENVIPFLDPIKYADQLNGESPLNEKILRERMEEMINSIQELDQLFCYDWTFKRSKLPWILEMVMPELKFLWGKISGRTEIIKEDPTDAFMLGYTTIVDEKNKHFFTKIPYVPEINHQTLIHTKYVEQMQKFYNFKEIGPIVYESDFLSKLYTTPNTQWLNHAGFNAVKTFKTLDNRDYMLEQNHGIISEKYKDHLNENLKNAAEYQNKSQYYINYLYGGKGLLHIPNLNKALTMVSSSDEIDEKSVINVDITAPLFDTTLMSTIENSPLTNPLNNLININKSINKTLSDLVNINESIINKSSNESVNKPINESSTDNVTTKNTAVEPIQKQKQKSNKPFPFLITIVKSKITVIEDYYLPPEEDPFLSDPLFADSNKKKSDAKLLSPLLNKSTLPLNKNPLDKPFVPYVPSYKNYQEMMHKFETTQDGLYFMKRSKEKTIIPYQNQNYFYSYCINDTL